jgi:hypothetical protein
VRRHLGVETQRQWSERAIARTTPIPLGLFALVTLLATRPARDGVPPVGRATWCPKAPVDGLAVDFVVESDRAQLSAIVQRVRDGRLRTNIGTVATLDDGVAAFSPTERRPGKTIIRVRP